jgi:L-threonylcarbamoyladenylate synthase
MIDKNELHTAAKKISGGGIVVIPTDTIYGLSCDPGNSFAVNRLKQLKIRDQKPFIILDSARDRIPNYFNYCKFLESFIDFLIEESLWPGRITIISDKNPYSGYSFLEEHQKVAVRFTDFEAVRYITDYLGSGIVSTSVNVTGEKHLNDLAMISSLWNSSVDYILKGNTGGHEASTIIELFGESRKIKILRSADEVTENIIRNKFSEV